MIHSWGTSVFLGYLIIPLTVQMIFLADFLVPVLIEERKKILYFFQENQ